MSVRNEGMALNAVNGLDTCMLLAQTLIARRYFKLSQSSIARLITRRGGDAYLSLYYAYIHNIVALYNIPS